MLYELATLSIRFGGLPAALDGIKAYVAESVAKGALLGAWVAEIGEPPKGGPDWLTGEMRSTIALPTALSPLA